MSPLILEESRFLLHSVMLGISVTFVYDCLRIVRNVIPHNMFWISLEDMLYWLLVSFSIFCLLYYENNGAFRWFAILGAALGMFVFQKTVGRIFVKYCSAVLIWFRKKLGVLVRFLMRPVKRTEKIVSDNMMAGRRKVIRMLRILKKRLTISMRMAKIELSRRCKKVQQGK